VFSVSLAALLFRELRRSLISTTARLLGQVVKDIRTATPSIVLVLWKTPLATPL